VATTALADYPDGVWLVRLDALADPSLVPAAVAAVLNVAEHPGRPLVEVLADAIAERDLVVVLDNCEHLIHACTDLAVSLLEKCPRLRLLATSREALALSGEIVWQVRPLTLPRRHQGRPPVRSEAVQLFLERALACRPDLSVDETEAAAVAQICHRLDGLPLAIELAASRIKVLAPQQLAERLNWDLRVLTGGNRKAMPRQQALRATIAWSHDLLSQAERALFRRLGAFVGGWTLDAAESVCAGAGIAATDVLDLLSGLVDKSLVNVESGGGAQRYRLLETIRNYATEHLEASGEVETLRDAHAEWFLAIAEQPRPDLWRIGQAEWAEELDSEHDNLRAALRWCVQRNKVEEGLRFCAALWYFWHTQGYYTEGREYLRQVLELPLDGLRSERHLAMRARALNGAGIMACRQGDYEAARTLLEESVALMRHVGAQRGLAGSLGHLAIVARNQGDYTFARSLQEQSLEIFRELGDQPGIAVSLCNLGNVVREQGDFEKARSLLEVSLGLSRELGIPNTIASSLGGLGELAYQHGDYQRARTLFGESLAIVRAGGDRRRMTWLLHNLGNLAGQQGDESSANSYYLESLALAQELGTKAALARSLEGFATLAATQRQALRALVLAGSAAHVREALGAPLSPADQSLLQARLEIAWRALGEEDGAAARAEGHRMSLEQALGYAARLAEESADPVTAPIDKPG
jgi:non-specific serine/threonine protein kinase